MVGDPREAHRVDVEEPHRGEEDPAEEEQEGKRAAAEPLPEPPRQEKGEEDNQKGKPLKGCMGIDRPARVDEGEVEGKKNFLRIEENHAPREHEAVRQPQRPFLADRLHGRPLEPCGVGAEGDAGGEPGDERKGVGPLHAPVPPPDEDEENRRDDGGCGF